MKMQREIEVDNFAGGGGASTGIEMATGRPIAIAVNHDEEAIAMHAANHPDTEHMCQSVWRADPRDVARGRPVGLAWFSPDCFPAGTMVLTRDGYRAIEEIQAGDEVLTHRLRWKKVTETHQTTKPVLTLRGHGHPGLTVSHEHPFYARQRPAPVWNNDRRSYEWNLNEPRWAPASMLDRGWYWGTPRQFPPSEAPAVGGRGMMVDESLMWLAGRYLGDGWSRITETRAELVIICGKHEHQTLRATLEAWPRQGYRAGHNELAWHWREVETAYQGSTNHRGLVEWLRSHFGHGAGTKTVPAWALGLSDHLRRALLQGYLSADGNRDHAKAFVECNTISKALAFGIKALANSLGHTAGIYLNSNNTTTIEGRIVSAQPIYKLRWRDEVSALHEQTRTENGIEWCPIREQSDTGQSATVYNIGVEDDESYIVEGIIVHNCKHFSKAKGSQPVKRNIRDLAWVVIHWAKLVQPRIIMLENVEEFRDWGPLIEGVDGKMVPCPLRKGLTYRRWKRELVKLGYRVEDRELRACDYGAPTIRKRLFVIARRDGLPIIWPAPTHAPLRLSQDGIVTEWARGHGLTLKDIQNLKPYRTAADCIDWSIPCPSIFERDRPLAENTMRRIAAGIKRYVIDAATPFIVPVTHHGDSRVHGIDEPLRTVTTAPRGEHALVTPFIAPRYGERPGQEPRTHAADKPIPTIVPTANGARLVAAFMAQHNTGMVGHPMTKPLSTIIQRGTTQGLVTSNLVKLRGTCKDGQPVDEPAPTITAGGWHIGEVRAFLIKYFGTDQDPRLEEPMHTVTTRDRFGLVTVAGEEYQIVDIGMRMLTPRELFRAQGFPESYIIDPMFNGKPLTKTSQVRCCGNSVCPPLSEALVRANYVPDQVAPTRRRPAAVQPVVAALF
jgi:site-specific DNA-cytosine methylase